MKRYYSSRQLAEIFAVNESTIKRWSDTGYIECNRTKGGHRRFSIQSVMQFVQQNKLEVPELAAELFTGRNLKLNLVAGNTDVLVPRLKDAALGGNLSDTLSILRAGLATKPNLLALYEEVVFPVLAQIGNDWASKSITVDVEHLASMTIRDAIVRLQSSIHREPENGLSVLLACYDGQLHDIVLQCIASYLQSRGWKVFNLGQSTPTPSLLAAIKKRKPDLVVLSALIVDHERQFLRDVNNKILPACHRVGAKLAVGGAQMKSRFGDRLKPEFVSESIADFEDMSEPKHYA
ncbi:MAG: cobalamin-dependent protein [Ignavibacteriales bacterium]|nr:cobalamin-dependent protein [Ignavibacteriales bacterium]